MYQIFVRWNWEGKEDQAVVELVRKDNGVIVTRSKVFYNNRGHIKGYCEGLVDAFKLFRLLDLIEGDELKMPRCLTQRGDQIRHLCADMERQD